MLIPQLLSILSCGMIVGTMLIWFPSMMSNILDAQSAIREGRYNPSFSPSSATSIIDGVVDSASPQIDLGDAVSLTSHGKMTFGYHTLLMRYPLDTYLEANGLGSSSSSLTTTEKTISIQQYNVRAASAGSFALAARSFGSSDAVENASFPSSASSSSLSLVVPPSEPIAETVRRGSSIIGAPAGAARNGGIIFKAASTTSDSGPLTSLIRVESNRGTVSLSQCSVLVRANSSTAAKARGFAIAGIDDVFATTTKATQPPSGGGGGGSNSDGSSSSGPHVSGSVPISATLAARSTSAALALFYEESIAVRPDNVFPHFASNDAVETFAPSIGLTSRDETYNKGQRGFPRQCDAFYLLKYLQTTKALTTERMAIPLVIDEDSSSSEVFPFGFDGARHQRYASTSSSSSGSATAKSAIFLVPIPAQFRMTNYPATDRECVRFGINHSTAPTNVGLSPSSVGGSVPIRYHRGCFVAVVSQLSDATATATANAISSIMGTIVSEWWSRNTITDANAYTDSVMAVRRDDASGAIVARDGSRWTFASVRVGPATSSAVYQSVVAPMGDVSASSYLPPMFISWVGGAYKIGTCAVPQFLDGNGARRIAVRL